MQILEEKWQPRQKCKIGLCFIFFWVKLTITRLPHLFCIFGTPDHHSTNHNHYMTVILKNLWSNLAGLGPWSFPQNLGGTSLYFDWLFCLHQPSCWCSRLLRCVLPNLSSFSTSSSHQAATVTCPCSGADWQGAERQSCRRLLCILLTCLNWRGLLCPMKAWEWSSNTPGFVSFTFSGSRELVKEYWGNLFVHVIAASAFKWRDDATGEWWCFLWAC